jgi:hypothetical protein
VSEILSEAQRRDAAARLRAAADLMDASDVKGAGMTLLLGLTGIAKELKRAYGPLARIVVMSKVESLFK